MNHHGGESAAEQPAPVRLDHQPILYRDRLVACATRDRMYLSAEFERRFVGDPELRVVLLMCCYARDVLTGVLPGPYSSQEARRYAQIALAGESRPSCALRIARRGRSLAGRWR